MLSVVKSAIILVISFFALKTNGRELNILIIGDSTDIGCMVDVDSISPLISGAMQRQYYSKEISKVQFCSKNSLWPSLMAKFISTDFVDHISIVKIGGRVNAISDWLPQGSMYINLSQGLADLKKSEAVFDYAFWYQDNERYEIDEKIYAVKLSKVLKNIAINTRVKKWIISRHATCGNFMKSLPDKFLLGVAQNHLFRRFPGPTSNDLASGLRSDDCLLNPKGIARMSVLWYDAVQRAEKIDAIVQQETLIKYFK